MYGQTDVRGRFEDGLGKFCFSFLVSFLVSVNEFNLRSIVCSCCRLSVALIYYAAEWTWLTDSTGKRREKKRERVREREKETRKIKTMEHDDGTDVPLKIYVFFIESIFFITAAAVRRRRCSRCRLGHAQFRFFLVSLFHDETKVKYVLLPNAFAFAALKIKPKSIAMISPEKKKEKEKCKKPIYAIIMVASIGNCVSSPTMMGHLPSAHYCNYEQ